MKLLTHNRIGDLCICYGFIKEFSLQYDDILLYIDLNICKYSNIERLFSSIPNIHFTEERFNDNEYDKLISSNWWFQQVYPWYENPKNPTPFPFGEDMIFDRFWYKLAEVPFNKKWDNFYLKRNIDKEKEIYYDVLGLKDNEEYIFLHDDPYNKDEDRTIQRKYINPNIKLIDIGQYPEISLLDTTYLIEKSKEVHVINSSFRTFIDLMNIKHNNLNYHKYARSNPAEQAAVRLKWNEISGIPKYGQFGEEEIIENYFGNNYIGGCIDIGATTGIDNSNSKYFEDKGWYSLCIEPNPNFYNQLKNNRLNTVNCAIAEYTGDAVFNIVNMGDYTGHEDAISALKIDKQLLKKHLKAGYKPTITPIIVQTMTLNDCIEKYYKYDTIDFISIDTEGTELDVLIGFSIEKWKPRLMIIENNFSSDTIENYLKIYGYKKIYRLGINDFYAK